MADNNSEADDGFANLVAEFEVELREWLSELDASVARLSATPPKGWREALEAVREIAHKIGGTAGIFGFDAVSDVALQLELYCIPFVEKGAVLDRSDVEKAVELANGVSRIAVSD